MCGQAFLRAESLDALPTQLAGCQPATMQLARLLFE